MVAEVLAYSFRMLEVVHALLALFGGLSRNDVLFLRGFVMTVVFRTCVCVVMHHVSLSVTCSLRVSGSSQKHQNWPIFFLTIGTSLPLET